MNVSKRHRVQIDQEKQPYDLSDVLLHNVLFYYLPPLCDITIFEFEELATERLKMLRIFEAATAKYSKYTEDWRNCVSREMTGEGLKLYLRLFNGNGNTPQDMEARRRDYLSHFILRFVYCRSRDLQEWFRTREMEVFRYKFMNLTPKDIREFKEAYKLKFEIVSPEEKKALYEGLLDSTPVNSAFKIDEMDFYKVHFTEVFELVAKRRCFLKAGFAYVSAQDFVHLVAPKYEKIIERGLLEHAEMLPELENDERLWSLIKGLNTSYTGKDYSVGSNDVAIEHLDALSKKSFPLCMRVCHDHLRATHKLKHNGRLQYGLFLKGIGVTLEDSLRFFKQEFSKVMDPEKFDKEHRYNIRYNYGKEGRRKDVSPFSCLKIISASGGGDDVHGCPFKLCSALELKSKLTGLGLSTLNADEVVEYARKGHFQIACSKYFEITHGVKESNGIQHPNGYFEQSQVVIGDRKPAAKGAPQRNRAQEVVLLKKKREEQQMDETMSQITDEDLQQYYKMMGQEWPKPKVEVVVKEEPKKTQVDLDDDADFDMIDESIVMQYG